MDKNELKFISAFVIAPGAIGGMGKALIEVQTTGIIDTQSLVNIPVSGLLGAIASTIVLARLIKFVPWHETLALGLIFGLGFPTILSNYTNESNLRLALESTQSEKTAIASSAVSNLETIATETSDPFTQKKAIAELAKTVEANPEVSTEALGAIASVSSASDNYHVQVQAIDLIVRSANTPEQKEQAIALLQGLDTAPFDLSKQIEKAIQDLSDN